MYIIAHIHTDFPTKFGIPRQSGLADAQCGKIVFTPEFHNPDAIRGIEAFSHLWLIWQFSENVRKEWSATVRPPRLGGNTRLGVFATRSSFRPNPIGLSCVKLLRIEKDGSLIVSGVDMMDGTPIYDIKPYLPFSDAHPDAIGGFADAFKENALQVEISDDLLQKIPIDKQHAAMQALEQDPRPSYHSDPERIYGMPFGDQDIRFTVNGDTLKVVEITPYSKNQ